MARRDHRRYSWDRRTADCLLLRFQSGLVSCAYRGVMFKDVVGRLTLVCIVWRYPYVIGIMVTSRVPFRLLIGTASFVVILYEK